MYLALQTQKGLYQYAQLAGLSHSEELLPRIETLVSHGKIALKDLDLIVVAEGPGSFTGLRIAMATAKGIAIGAGADIVTVSTLDIYGQIYGELPYTVLPVIDAKKNQFFGAFYQKGKRISEYYDAKADDILAIHNENILLTGIDGLLFQNSSSKEYSFLHLTPENTAVTLLEMGYNKWKISGAAPDDAAPVYLRKSEAELHRDKKKNDQS